MAKQPRILMAVGVVDFSKLTKKELLGNREKLAEVANKLSEKIASLEDENLKERVKNTCLRARVSEVENRLRIQDKAVDVLTSAWFSRVERRGGMVESVPEKRGCK